MLTISQQGITIASIDVDLNLNVIRETSVSAISDGDISVGFGTEILQSTITVNVTVPNSVVYLFVETKQNGISSINTIARIRRDDLSGEILGNIQTVGSNAPIQLEVTDNNPTLGINTYVFTSQRVAAVTTTWDTFPNSWNGLLILIEPV